METLRTKSTSAVLTALRKSDLGPMQRLKVRIALLNEDNRQEIEQFIFMKGQEESQIKSDVSIEAVDWDKLIEFIDKILPLILKLISMFS